MVPSVLDAFIQQLLQKKDLAPDQVGEAVDQLIDARVSAGLKADFLTALARKGETIAEITAFARELRARAIQPPLSPEMRSGDILDVCGTGGDKLNTFNISTAVAIVAASAGIVVAKHGNRAITSQSGSADVLEALGIAIDLSPERAAEALRDHHFAFFFAPKYHPAFEHIGPARRLCAERGLRTIFNFLGPLLNPARPTLQLVGVAQPELCEPMARALQSLGVRRAIVVAGTVPRSGREAGNGGTAPETGVACLDELSVFGDTYVAEFHHERGFHSSVLPLTHFPVQPGVLTDICGGDARTNAGIIQRLFRGEERGPRRDAVLLNAAAALFIAGRSEDLIDGWETAVELIDSGKAGAKLGELASS